MDAPFHSSVPGNSGSTRLCLTMKVALFHSSFSGNPGFSMMHVCHLLLLTHDQKITLLQQLLWQPRVFDDACVSSSTVDAPLTHSSTAASLVALGALSVAIPPAWRRQK
eukprot:1145431-Pelagomonas_calceolata.AAC.5